MADATAIITALGQQVAQLIVDKAILQVELAELQAKYDQAADIEIVEDEPND